MSNVAIIITLCCIPFAAFLYFYRWVPFCAGKCANALRVENWRAYRTWVLLGGPICWLFAELARQEIEIEKTK